MGRRKARRNGVTPPLSQLGLSLIVIVFASGLMGSLVTCSGDAHYEFIVVGGGSAGCVLATRLSQEYSVLLLEAGGIPHPDLDIPAKLSGYFNNKKYFKTYKTVLQNNTGLMTNGVFSFLSGSTLGGGSSINAQVYNRGSPYDYDKWANITGDPSWSYAEMMKYFKMIEDYGGDYPSPEHHGIGGPIPITRPKYAPGLDAWLEGGIYLGYSVADPNGPQKIGFSPIEFNRKLGRRVSSYQGYLKPIQPERPNLKIMTEAKVEKIIFKGNKAVGVRYILENGMYVQNVYASKEVILSAGAFNSPAILMRSGVGPRHVLEAANISPIQILPVGNNLHDHVHVHLYFLLEKDKANMFVPERDLTPETWKIFEETGDGPYSTFMGVTGQAFLSSSLNAGETNPGWPDIHLMLVQTPASFEWITELKEKGNQNDEIRISVMVMVARPKSRGSVTLNPMDVNGDPLIDFQYLTHSDDMSVLVDAVKQVLQLFEETKPYQQQNARYSNKPIQFCKHHTFLSDEYWKCYVNYMMVPALHAAGTCRMGNEFGDPNTVVDSKLKVIGLQNLRVIDASIMPEVTNANTNAPALVIGEKGAAEILKYWNEFKEKTHHEL